MTIPLILHALQNNPVAAAMQGTTLATAWFFPIIESFHVISVAVMFGSLFMVDVRLIGLAENASPASQVLGEFLPYTWIAFGIAVITGSLLFLAKAEQYFYNLQMQLKFLFMFLAGANMLIFHRGALRRVREWDRATPPPTVARLAGLLSIAFWITVIFMGRWIGFTTNLN